MQENKIINLLGEVAIASPLFFIAIPTGTWIPLIISIVLISSFKRLYKFEFHFDKNNEKWCLISSFIILIISISLFYMFKNYYVIFIFCILCSLGSAKLGMLNAHYLKLKEITPYYNMLKAKYEKVDFKKMTEEEIYETCRLNNISVKVANRFIEHYIHGKTYQQIADKEYTTLEAIRNCFNRARNTMKI